MMTKQASSVIHGRSLLIGLTAVTLMICIESKAPAAPHPFHISTAEVEWNAESNRLEVALKIWPIDLETALAQKTKQRVDLDKTENVDGLILEYLQANFRLKNQDQQVAKLYWVGKEVAVKNAWLYFEVEIPRDSTSLEMSNLLLFDVLRDQKNTVNFKLEKQLHSLVFDAAHPLHDVDSAWFK